jgi:hypothetical protein
MTEDSLESWFWALCANLESKLPESLNELERGVLEFRELRSRAGGEGSAAYYTDSTGITPSRLASFLNRFATPRVAAAAQYFARLCPDDAPFDPAERGHYLENRLIHQDALGLQGEWPADVDAAEVLDTFCMGQGAEVLYRNLKSLFPD